MARKEPRSITFAHTMGLLTHLHLYRRDWEQAREWAEKRINLASKEEFGAVLAAATIHRGAALVELGAVEEGIAQMHQGLNAYRKTRHFSWFADFLALTAEALGKTGQAHQGLDLIAEAQALVARTETHHIKSELYRLRGELWLLTDKSEDQVVSSFHQAIEIAQGQGAKSLELRAATSLARLWQSQGKTAEARQLLEAIYSWFTEGFDTGDLKEARTLLDTLV